MNIDRANAVRASLGLAPFDNPVGKHRSIVPSQHVITGPQMTKPARGPGDVFAAVIFKITGQLTGDCGKCGERKIQMNKWGWLGCLKPKNRKLIVGWIVEEAIARGHPIAEKRVFGLVRAAFKELKNAR